jgi:hypothetical protein
VEERRHDDERIDKISDTLTEVKILVEQVHKSMFGHNGNPGLNREFERLKGGLAVWKWAVGSGGLVGLIALIVTVYKHIGG